MFVKDLLKEIPADTSDVVAEACRTFSQLVRTQLSDNVLRWKLAHGKGEYRQMATVKNDWGEIGRPSERTALPESLTKCTIPDDLAHAARLSVHWPAIRGLGDHARRLGPLFAEREAPFWRSTQLSPAMARATLDGASSLSLELTKLATPVLPDGRPFDLVRFLLTQDVESDVLGLYQYDRNEGHRSSRPSVTWDHPFDDATEEASPARTTATSGTVVVYWGIVGLVAAALDVSPRALAVVVLAHELSHAYTHLGHDRDGHRWSGADFARSDLHLKEALAQYYTHHICEELNGRIPGLFEAYWRLLEKQPEPYQLHLPLVLESTPEQVAAAVAPMRSGPAGYQDLLEVLRIGPIFSGGQPEAWRLAVSKRRSRSGSGD